jgi:hypothetical protein
MIFPSSLENVLPPVSCRFKATCNFLDRVGFSASVFWSPDHLLVSILAEALAVSYDSIYTRSTMELKRENAKT